jgi:hypothetical protein
MFEFPGSGVGSLFLLRYFVRIIGEMCGVEIEVIR